MPLTAVSVCARSYPASKQNGAKILYTIHTNIPLLGDFKITQTLVSTWIVMALLSGLAIWLGHGLKLENVSKRQAAAEFIVTRLDQFVHDNMGYHFDQYIPLIGSIFALSIGCNLISVVGLWSPTADLNTEYIGNASDRILPQYRERIY